MMNKFLPFLFTFVFYIWTMQAVVTVNPGTGTYKVDKYGSKVSSKDKFGEPNLFTMRKTSLFNSKK